MKKKNLLLSFITLALMGIYSSVAARFASAQSTTAPQWTISGDFFIEPIPDLQTEIGPNLDVGSGLYQLIYDQITGNAFAVTKGRLGENSYIIKIDGQTRERSILTSISNAIPYDSTFRAHNGTLYIMVQEPFPPCCLFAPSNQAHEVYSIDIQTGAKTMLKAHQDTLRSFIVIAPDKLLLGYNSGNESWLELFNTTTSTVEQSVTLGDLDPNANLSYLGGMTTTSNGDIFFNADTTSSIPVIVEISAESTIQIKNIIPNYSSVLEKTETHTIVYNIGDIFPTGLKSPNTPSKISTRIDWLDNTTLLPTASIPLPVNIFSLYIAATNNKIVRITSNDNPISSLQTINVDDPTEIENLDLGTNHEWDTLNRAYQQADGSWFVSSDQHVYSVAPIQGRAWIPILLK